MNKTKKALLSVLIFFCAVFCYCAVSACASRHILICSTYTISADITEELRIVQLTDLHNERFGEDNEKLVKCVESLQPDLILMTGDMVNRGDPSIVVVVDLVSKLSKIAPVYYGYGNHERAWEKEYGDRLDRELEAAGTVILENRFVDIDLKGCAIRIGGYSGYYRQPHMLTKDKDQAQKELQFAADFENTKAYKILLCHIPTAWLDWNYMDLYPVDLVLCGHYHGGQVQLPGSRGLYAPYVGFFPRYNKGFFQGETASVVLSAGLGTNSHFPRINNPAEIVSIVLTPKSGTGS